ncbi:N-acetylmuramoyl-L-alanine amidase [Butyrivibrio hungatei]|uniref:N-acetylmuramoyl-L-alanine amidase n=1 Tax=Butyrivibrio hungatei TaxID=185008 RepID=A0A1D9P4Z7_9FIRM|nr:N-acetylmuramoyl-L-alanine amidase [Butyrivibrio hungatei]AOZ97245.1 N-acetylmuramoyl-L-alanine amidase [Butyrivibrio hungatei]
MNNSEMKKMAIRTAVFGVVSIAVMLQRSATKHIMITDAAGTHVDRGNAEDSYNILIDRNVTDSQSGKLIIPLAKTVSSDDIILEDKYIDHELKIYIESREEGFYLDNAVLTDLDILESAVCYAENDTGSVCLDFKFDGLYANASSLTENSTIEVSFAKPKDMYENIVVVDCESEGAGNSRALLDMSLAVRGIATTDDDNNIKFYYTRLSDDEADIEKRCALIKDSGADFVVELKLGGKGVSSFYNGQYFLRDFNNAEFANILEKNCAYKLGASAEGVFEDDGSDQVLCCTKVPAARVEISKDYSGADDSKKIAEGVYQAILEAFEEKK